MNRKSVLLITLAGTALMGSGCQATAPLQMQARQLAIRMGLIQVPVSTHRMSGTLAKGDNKRSNAMTFRFPRGVSSQSQARLAVLRRAIPSPNTVPEVNAALHMVQADTKTAPELGQNIALFDKYSYQSETFKDGTTRTEFEYGVKGTRGQGTMTGRNVTKNGAVSVDKLTVRLGSGKTIVLK